MPRWLGLIVTIGLLGSPASAQVFKPKSKKAATTEKTTKSSTDSSDEKPVKKSAKKQPRSAKTKKRVTSKKKSAVSDRGRPDDLTPDLQPKGADKDYVKIWDDDDIE